MNVKIQESQNKASVIYIFPKSHVGSEEVNDSTKKAVVLTEEAKNLIGILKSSPNFEGTYFNGLGHFTVRIKK